MSDGADRSVTVRRAERGDRAAVLGVLDGANLATDADAIAAAIERSEVLVAVPAAPERSVILGALVLDGEEITHVAVRRRRRGQGIGTALVREAATDRGTLVAEFDGDVRPFYEALGFVVEPTPRDGRFAGRRSDPAPP